MGFLNQIKRKLLNQSHQDRLNREQIELTNSVTASYELDLLRKAVMTEDLDILAGMNRDVTYQRTEIDENGLMYHPDKKEEGEDVNRSLQIGHNFNEYTKAPSPLNKLIPLAAAGLVAAGIVTAALLWPKDEVSIDPVEKDTNTDSVVRIID